MRTIGAPFDADLCNVIKGKWVQIMALLVPHSLKDKRRERGTFTLYLQARGAEADSPIERFQVSWDGGWHDGDTEMQKHFKVEQLPPVANLA